MNTIIGFIIMEFSITGFITFVFGWEMDLKEKILMMVVFDLFISLLTVGIGALIGDRI